LTDLVISKPRAASERPYIQVMKKTLLVAAILSLPVYQGHCQEMEHAPAFEVAAIAPCPPGTPEPPGEHMGMVQFTSPGGRFNAKATSLKYLLEWAYGILPAQHSAGPSWLGDDRYDIVAKAEGNVTDAQMKLMTRTLIAERFKLKFHRETREVPVLVMSLGKTAPKLFPPKDEERQSIRVEPQMGLDQKPVSWRVVATRFSFAQLSETFSRHLDRVIVNRTGMEGDFDFTLDMTPDENQPNPVDASIIILAMRDQLGLVVKSEKAPVDFLVIDSAEKVVAGN
jgi:uncharacterized protein (TIGR03435 family)